MPDIDEKKPTTGDGEDGYSDEIDIINASGHVQELDRSFGLWSICSVAIVADDAWGAGGGALVVALYAPRVCDFSRRTRLTRCLSVTMAEDLAFCTV